MVDKVEKQEIVFEDEFKSIKEEIKELRDKLDSDEFNSSQKQFSKIEKVEPEVEIQKVEDIPSFKPEIKVEPEFIKPVLEEKKEIPSEEVVEEHIVDEKPLYTEKDIEDVAQEEPEPEEVNLFNTIIEGSKEKPVEPYTTYDIRYVEDVLNNANREVKISMNMRWYDIERNSTSENLSYSKMIIEGRLVATDGKMIIIEYVSPSICNRMMKPEIKEKVIEILSDFYNKKIDFLALPKVVWEEKSQEFIQKWKQGEKNIKLSAIKHPSLKEMPTINRDIEDMTPDSVKEAISLFGSDLVKIKKGE